MSAVEAMAKAAWEAENGNDDWATVSEKSQKKLVEFMRAALLALAEVDLPYKAVNRGMETYYKAPETDEAAALTNGFRAICKALAEARK